MGHAEIRVDVSLLTKQIAELKSKDPKDPKIAQLEAEKAQIDADIAKGLTGGDKANDKRELRFTFKDFETALQAEGKKDGVSPTTPEKKEKLIEDGVPYKYYHLEIDEEYPYAPKQN